MSDTLFALLRATWPPVAETQAAGWTIRTGGGGGSRVSAATWDATGDATWGGAGLPDIALAEAEMAALGQSAKVMIRPQDTALDTALAARGYRVQDRTLGLAAPVAALAAAPPPVSSFAIWPPLAIQRELWAEGGIDAPRLEVMDRVNGPKTALFGRASERPAGTAFVAMGGADAMLHALEVAPAYRRQGLARIMMRHAALWAQDQGATRLYLLVTEENAAARALYASLNFEPVGHYHYRTKDV